MTAEVSKLEKYKLANFPTSFNNIKTKEDDLDVGVLEIVPIDLKKLGDAVDKKSCKRKCTTN